MHATNFFSVTRTVRTARALEWKHSDETKAKKGVGAASRPRACRAAPVYGRVQSPTARAYTPQNTRAMNRDREALEDQLTQRSSAGQRYRLMGEHKNVWERLSNQDRLLMRSMSKDAHKGCPMPACANAHAAEYGQVLEAIGRPPRQVLTACASVYLLCIFCLSPGHAFSMGPRLLNANICTYSHAPACMAGSLRGSNDRFGPAATFCRSKSPQLPRSWRCCNRDGAGAADADDDQQPRIC
jgi:hypothetical protein